MPASATLNVQTDIDPDVQERAAAVFSELGITVSDAIRLFLIRTADEGAFPFTLAVEPAGYDAWFRAKVQEALDDPRPDVSDEEVENYFDRRKAALVAEIGNT